MRLTTFLKHMALLLAMLFFAGQPAWAVGSSAARDVDKSGTCQADSKSPTQYSCWTANPNQDPNVFPLILTPATATQVATIQQQASNDWVNCENWNVTGMSTGIPGSTGNCWNFAGAGGLKNGLLSGHYYYDKSGSNVITISDANKLANSGYTHDEKGMPVANFCCVGLGIGATQYIPNGSGGSADVYNASNTINYQFEYDFDAFSNVTSNAFNAN